MSAGPQVSISFTADELRQLKTVYSFCSMMKALTPKEAGGVTGKVQAAQDVMSALQGGVLASDASPALI